jgi:hypothetical protein
MDVDVVYCNNIREWKEKLQLERKFEEMEVFHWFI